MIHSSDSQPAKLDTLGYREALFDTKFSGVSVATSFLETPLSTALGKGVAAVAAVAGVAGLSTPAATTVVVRREENNMELKGEWSRLWERQLQRCVCVCVCTCVNVCERVCVCVCVCVSVCV